MERDITQMNQLIGDVLTLARGLAQEPPCAVDLAEFLQQLATDFDTPTQPVQLVCPVRGVSVSATALQRVLVNLLQNAQRYAPGKPLDLVAKLEDGVLHIGVLDRGPGIAAEKIEAMFEPFARLEHSRSPATGGAGLGLAIVRALARANGWTVDLAARAGGGLEAWVHIPLTQPQPPSASLEVLFM
jgi:two-component system osmolarity sensor histidine kinase EnvZ